MGVVLEAPHGSGFIMDSLMLYTGHKQSNVFTSGCGTFIYTAIHVGVYTLIPGAGSYILLKASQ